MREEAISVLAGFDSCPLTWSSVSFCGERKTRELGDKLSEQGETQQQTYPHVASGHHYGHQPFFPIRKPNIRKFVQVVSRCKRLSQSGGLWEIFYLLIQIVILTDLSGQVEILNWTLQSLKVIVVKRVTSTTWNT